MEIPVTGIIISNEAGSEHSHSIYLTTWDGRPLHHHQFSGVTSFNVGHDHKYAGTTEPAPSGVPHTHKYFTVTSFNDGHKHEIRGETGPAISLPGGGHFHRFHGWTTVNGSHPHSHEYAGKTSTTG
ncbi:YmaF family protein [Peribacillus sp. SCS-155]|uniref:YmaF family protein n=1 Tax=Peribacillus sedimenti TaxID=3115297 RepID=UPI0039064057